MTAKEELPQLLEAIDERQAHHVLPSIRYLVDKSTNGAIELEDRPEIEVMVEGKPLDDDNPIWGMMGLFASDPNGPTDVGRQHDNYLTDIYADLHE